MANSMTRWNPASELFRTRFNRFFDQALSDLARTYEGGEEVAERNWLPPVDIRETGDALILSAELPGMTRDNVDITLENNVLSIHGERKFEKDTEEGNYHRIERAYGTFSRSFTLPSNVDAEKVEARFDNGVLHVEVPKADEAKPRKVTIS